MYVCMHVCMDECMFVCINVYVNVCMYVCIYLCMYVCMYVGKTKIVNGLFVSTIVEQPLHNTLIDCNEFSIETNST